MSDSDSTAERLPLPRALWDRFGHLVREVGKFGIVGGVSFVVDTLVLNLLLNAFGPIWAKVASTVVAATLAFIGNRYWTWRHHSGTGLQRDYLLYFVFNAIGLGIAVACLGISHYGLGAIWPSVFHSRLADNAASQIVGTGVGTIFRFWAYRTIVFTGARVAQGEPVTGDPSLSVTQL